MAYQNTTANIKSVIKLRLQDHFKQTWWPESTSPKTINYRLFKDSLKFEDYFDILSNKDILTMVKFRTINHKLPIENGRLNNIPRELCPLCKKRYRRRIPLYKAISCFSNGLK